MAPLRQHYACQGTRHVACVPAPLALLGATEAAAEISRARALAACPAPIGLRPPRALRPPRDETQSGMAVVCDGRDAPYLSVRPRKYPPRKKITFNNNSLIPRA